MLRPAAFCATLLMCASAALAADTTPKAPAGAYRNDPSHTSLNWSLNHLGLSHYVARFTKVEARLDWDPEKPEASSLSVEIDPLSVRTDYPWPEKEDFDARIGKDDNFLAGKPISFVSETIRITGDNTGTVEGQLTFRGETKPASLDVTFNGSIAQHPVSKQPVVGFSATGTIRRSEWGLGFGVPQVGDDVRIAIEAEFVPAEKPGE